MATELKWTRIASGNWELRDEAGRKWASVSPAPKDFRADFYKAACHREEMKQYIPGSGGTSRPWWLVRQTVSGAKRSAEAWLRRNACAVENFQIAA